MKRYKVFGITLSLGTVILILSMYGAKLLAGWYIIQRFGGTALLIFVIALLGTGFGGWYCYRQFEKLWSLVINPCPTAILEMYSPQPRKAVKLFKQIKETLLAFPSFVNFAWHNAKKSFGED